MNIIEPCCAERQLGQLLREAHGHAALFQTNGDVTAKLFIKDTMLLSGDRPRTLTIAASEMPQEAMRLVQRYAQLGYISHLRLMLPSDVSPQLSDLISHFSSLISHFDVALLPDDKPIPELMMWRGSSHTVVIQGTMPDVKTPALHLYAGQLGGNNSPAIRAATAAFEALFRARRVELETTKATTPAGESEDEPEKPSFDEAQGTPVPSVAMVSQQEQPKKTTRKKTTTDEHPEEMA